MTPKKPVLDLIRDGNRLSDEIMLGQLEHLAWPRRPLKLRRKQAAGLAPSRWSHSPII
jgi:hypothetical protein